MFYVTGANPAFTIATCLEKGWAIRLTCLADDCPAHAGGFHRHTIDWGERELEAMDGRTTLGDLAERAKCSRCGGRTGHVSTRAGGWSRSPI